MSLNAKTTFLCLCLTAAAATGTVAQSLSSPPSSSTATAVSAATASEASGSDLLKQPALGWMDFALFDAPYGTEHGMRGPSMQQSLDFSVAAHEGMHLGIEKLFGPRRKLGRTAIVLADIVATTELVLPLTMIWVHEEFHRAAMGRRGVDSHNDVYNFDISSEWIAVSRLRDEDIARMKREHPAEWVRVNVAGIEGEHLMVRDLERRRFFGASNAWHLPMYWITKFSTIGYVLSGSWDSMDKDTDESNARDGADVRRRDFTGHDFIGWVYDLHRPDEPYEARGIHPSGVGIDRYRKRAHLTDAEKAHLSRQGKLHFLNLIDPFIFGLERGVAIGRGPDPMRVTAGVSHYPTSFGHAVDANLMAKKGHANMALAVHTYRNRDRTFPGLDAELIDYPITLAGRAWQVTPRLAVWMQPERQRYDDRTGRVGGLASVRLRTALSHRLGGFVTLESKSAGWVAGNAYLDRNLSVRIGLSATAW